MNEAFVRRFFPSEDPIGKRFCIDPTNKTYWYTIVGVVGDMHRQGLEKRAIPEYFGPYIPMPTGRADLIVRTQRDPLATVPAVRRALADVIPNILIPTVATADQQLRRLLSRARFPNLVVDDIRGLGAEPRGRRDLRSRPLRGRRANARDRRAGCVRARRRRT